MENNYSTLIGLLAVGSLIVVLAAIYFGRRVLGKLRRDGMYLDDPLLQVEAVEAEQPYLYRFTASIPVRTVGGATERIQVHLLLLVRSARSRRFYHLSETRRRIITEVQRQGFGRRWDDETWRRLLKNLEEIGNRKIAEKEAETKAKARAEKTATAENEIPRKPVEKTTKKGGQ